MPAPPIGWDQPYHPHRPHAVRTAWPRPPQNTMHHLPCMAYTPFLPKLWPQASGSGPRPARSASCEATAWNPWPAPIATTTTTTTTQDCHQSAARAQRILGRWHKIMGGQDTHRSPGHSLHKRTHSRLWQNQAALMRHCSSPYFPPQLPFYTYHDFLSNSPSILGKPSVC